MRKLSAPLATAFLGVAALTACADLGHKPGLGLSAAVNTTASPLAECDRPDVRVDALPSGVGMLPFDQAIVASGAVGVRGAPRSLWPQQSPWG